MKPTPKPHQEQILELLKKTAKEGRVINLKTSPGLGKTKKQPK